MLNLLPPRRKRSTRWSRSFLSVRTSLTVVALFCSLALFPPSRGQTNLWTGGNGAREASSNWSNDLPTSTSTVLFNDSASIASYSVGLDATETVANVLFSATNKGVFWTVSNA